MLIQTLVIRINSRQIFQANGATPSQYHPFGDGNYDVGLNKQSTIGFGISSKARRKQHLTTNVSWRSERLINMLRRSPPLLLWANRTELDGTLHDSMITEAAVRYMYRTRKQKQKLNDNGIEGAPSAMSGPSETRRGHIRE